MAYAELWAPIQNATNSLNQTINNVADREARRAGQGLQNLMAADQMAGNQFSREMSAASNARQERQLEMEAGALSERQRIAKAQEARASQIHALALPEAQRQAAIAEVAMKPKGVNLYNFIPNNGDSVDWAFKSTDAANRMAQVFGGKDAVFDQESGNLINSKTNQPIMLTDVQRMSAMRGAQGIALSYADPLDARSVEVNNQAAKVQRMKDDLKEMDHLDRRGYNKGKTKLAKVALKREQDRLDALQNRPKWEALKSYEIRGKMLDQIAIQYAASGGNPEVLTIMRDAAKYNNDQITELRKAKIESLTGGTEGKNMVSKMIHLLDAEGNVIATRTQSFPKTTKSLTPKMLDDSLEGNWVFGEEIEQRYKNGKVDATWKTGYDAGIANYGKWDEKGQFIITPGLQDRYKAFGRLYNKYYDESKHPGRAMVAARDEIEFQEGAYWENFADEAKKRNLDPRVPSQYAQVEKIFEDQGWNKMFADDYGYVPSMGTRPKSMKK